VPCACDCNNSGTVTVDEIIRGVNIAVGSEAVDLCQSLDRNHDNQVDESDLMQAVSDALEGCGG